MSGLLAPESAADVRETYEDLGGAAQTVTREVAREMGFDREEYGERMTSDTVETARDALFASLLEVESGSREELDAVVEETGYDLDLRGNENVGRAAWHVARVSGTVVAVTFAEERDAALAALRRQAHGSVYRPLIEGEDGPDGSAERDE
mgnify:CR=1 FL=1